MDATIRSIYNQKRKEYAENKKDFEKGDISIVIFKF